MPVKQALDAAATETTDFLEVAALAIGEARGRFLVPSALVLGAVMF